MAESSERAGRRARSAAEGQGGSIERAGRRARSAAEGQGGSIERAGRRARSAAEGQGGSIERAGPRARSAAEGQGGSIERALTADETSYVAAARAKADVLYAGVVTPHRSCGIALAETFGLPTPAYQSLRRGGITGKGACGAIRAGEQVLGELLGDPDPTGQVTAELRGAVTWYQAAWQRVRFSADPAPDITCDHLVRPHGEFTGAARKAFCTSLAADVAALTAEALCRFAPAQWSRPPITPIAEHSRGPKR